MSVLSLDNVSLEFPTAAGPARALNRVSLEVKANEIVGLVGESGSGKSVIALTALRLLPRGGYHLTGGTVTVLGRDVMGLSRRELEDLRGGEAAIVFQEPMNALNPSIRIGEQIEAVLRRHRDLPRPAAREAALGLLKDMRIDEPETVMRRFPSALSGGMRQRVLLAMAFACGPKLLIADEPTTALDVSVQAEVLTLIRERARATGAATLFISHDMAVVSQLCDRVYVLYGGEVMEQGPTGAVLSDPRHPYTRALLAASPLGKAPRGELVAIPGHAPSQIAPEPGCRFRARCAFAHQRCVERPPLFAQGDQAAACWLLAEGRA
jgi:peptide/nickel transport system ATP-binding protein